jgi:hypothetical protein
LCYNFTINDDNIKMDLKDVGCGGGVDWFYLAQNIDTWRSLVNTVMNILLPYIAGNFFTSGESVSFSRRTVLHEVS